jgi:hypothetical protein
VSEDFHDCEGLSALSGEFGTERVSEPVCMNRSFSVVSNQADLGANVSQRECEEVIRAGEATVVPPKPDGDRSMHRTRSPSSAPARSSTKANCWNDPSTSHPTHQPPSHQTPDRRSPEITDPPALAIALIAPQRAMYGETCPDGKRRYTVAQIAAEFGIT